MSLLFLQLRGELRKVFARKRTHIGFGAYIVIELFFLFCFQFHGPQEALRRAIEHGGGAFGNYFSGTTIALIVVQLSFLLPMLYLALVGGDVVAKEVEDGTMRMALCRPISRVRLLLLKYAACVLYTFALYAFIGASAWLICTLRQGMGGLLAGSLIHRFVTLYDTGEGLFRYSVGMFCFALSFLSVTTLAFMFSCFNMKPAAATVVTLTAFIADDIFYHVPYFESFKHYFLTHNMSTWERIFATHIPWQRMTEDYVYLLAVDATFVIIGVVAFQQRDFKS